MCERHEYTHTHVCVSSLLFGNPNLGGPNLDSASHLSFPHTKNTVHMCARIQHVILEVPLCC